MFDDTWEENKEKSAQNAILSPSKRSLSSRSQKRFGVFSITVLKNPSQARIKHAHLNCFCPLENLCCISLPLWASLFENHDYFVHFDRQPPMARERICPLRVFSWWFSEAKRRTEIQEVKYWNIWPFEITVNHHCTFTARRSTQFLPLNMQELATCCCGHRQRLEEKKGLRRGWEGWPLRPQDNGKVMILT